MLQLARAQPLSAPIQVLVPMPPILLAQPALMPEPVRVSVRGLAEPQLKPLLEQTAAEPAPELPQPMLVKQPPAEPQLARTQ